MSAYSMNWGFAWLFIQRHALVSIMILDVRYQRLYNLLHYTLLYYTHPYNKVRIETYKAETQNGLST